MNTAVDAYRTAVEFIHMSDTIRVMESVGWKPPASMYYELRAVRERLDIALVLSRTMPTPTDWTETVRRRLLSRGPSDQVLDEYLEHVRQGPGHVVYPAPEAA